MRGSGKDQFYSTLNLPKDAREILKWYRRNFDSIRDMTDVERKNIEEARIKDE